MYGYDVGRGGRTDERRSLRLESRVNMHACTSNDINSDVRNSPSTIVISVPGTIASIASLLGGSAERSQS